MRINGVCNCKIKLSLPKIQFIEFKILGRLIHLNSAAGSSKAAMRDDNRPL
jgi:hypothetical protein